VIFPVESAETSYFISNYSLIILKSTKFVPPGVLLIEFVPGFSYKIKQTVIVNIYKMVDG